MIISRAKKKDIPNALEIARSLKEWFTKEAIEKMQRDFSKKNLFVATENKFIIGFLCFLEKKDYLKILWFGVKKDYQRKAIGTKMLDRLVLLAEKSRKNSIRVETLTAEDDYPPYKLTQAFYSKNGFKKIATKQPKKLGEDIQDVLEKKLK